MKDLTERVASYMTWGRVAFVIIAGVVLFSGFTAGAISGSLSVAPSVAVLKAVTDKHEIRLEKIETIQRERSIKMGEIIGYLRAIADTLGVRKADIKAGVDE